MKYLFTKENEREDVIGFMAASEDPIGPWCGGGINPGSGCGGYCNGPASRYS